MRSARAAAGDLISVPIARKTRRTSSARSFPVRLAQERLETLAKEGQRTVELQFPLFCIFSVFNGVLVFLVYLRARRRWF